MVKPDLTLADQREIMRRLNVKTTTARAIMERVPKVTFPGVRKVYVRWADVEKLMEKSTTWDYR